MSNRNSILVLACLVLLFASVLSSPTFAERSLVSLPEVYTSDSAVVGATLAPMDTDVLSFEITAPVDVRYFTYGQGLFSNFGILPEGTLLIRFGWTDLTLTVHNNGGSLPENWASDLRLGHIYNNPGASQGYSYVGTSPFPFDGAGTFGPSSGYIDIQPPARQVPPATRDFQFATWSYYNDQTGLPAATWTSGTVYVVVQFPAVDTERRCLSAIKALYR